VTLFSELPAAVELADPRALLAAQQASFERQWARLWERSEFYQEKLASAGLRRDQVPDLRDLGDVPLSTKDELRESFRVAPPYGRHAAINMSQVRQVQFSSGTTGRPGLVAVTPADAAGWSELQRRGLVAGGCRSTDVVVHCFAMSRGWVGGLPLVEGVLAVGAALVPIGAEPGTDRILDLISLVTPTVLLAPPGLLLRIAERAAERGINPPGLGIRKIITGGEPGGGIPSVRAAIEKAYDAEVSEIMGGADLSPLMWGECETGEGMHWVGPDHVWLELVNPDTDEPVAVEEGAVGEVVYSHLQREAFPLLRFRHRDLLLVTGTGRCACGRQTPRVRCVGRTDDMLIVRGVNVFPSAVRDVIAEFGELSSSFRILRPKGQYVLPGPVALKVAHARGHQDRSVTQPGDVAERLERRLHERLGCRFTVSMVPESEFDQSVTKDRFFEEEG
jgi:phenylacetate-CoA ligase